MKNILHTMLITSSPEIARFAEESGVDRIFIDMETQGKAERQGHLDTHKSAHTFDDILKVSSVLRQAELMVRLNPPSLETPIEINQAIQAGAQRLMLPMFTQYGEVDDFFQAVDGQAAVTLLVETPQALSRLPAILPLLGTGDHIHFGLNDLNLGIGTRFLFEPLAGGLLEGACQFCRTAEVPFGFGGVGRVGHGNLPAEWIIGEHVRLGSQWVILSRAFHAGAADLQTLKANIDLEKELLRLQETVEFYLNQRAELLDDNRKRLCKRVFELAGQGPSHD